MSVAGRVTRTMTADLVALATSLSAVDPSWGTVVAPVADGWAVLCGPGMFVNRLEGAGVGAPLSADHLAEFERLAQRVGVLPAVALPDFAEATNLDLLSAGGYQPDSAVSVSVMSLDHVADVEAVRERVHQIGFALETVASRQALEHWQRAAAVAWGHHTALGRRTSDAFAAAAARAPGSSLLLVRDVNTGGTVATCALTIRDGIATLGAMSVIPTERRRGVQAAAITLRLAAAVSQGCDLAVTSTAVGGDSERNVARHGFVPSHRVTTWSRRSQPEKAGLDRKPNG
jgi:hypothetical protein